jgi:hypothetical protein
MLYRVCVCFSLRHLFFLNSWYHLGVKLKPPARFVSTRNTNVWQEESVVWVFGYSVCTPTSCVCVCVSVIISPKKFESKKKNWIEKKKSEEIGWNAIRHRLLPPSLILQKSHFRRFSPGNNFFFLNSSRRKMCQMVITISNQVCKYICRPSCVWKKSFSISQS